MKYFSLLLLFCVAQLSFAQNITNTLKGNFKTKSKDAMYSFFDFDGAGQVNVSEYKSYPYFERNDSVIIILQKSAFVFKKNKNELKGVSDWIDGQIYKSNDKVFQYAVENPDLNKRNIHLSNYYDINIKNISKYLNTANLNFDDVLKDLKAKNEVLCKEDFDLSCIQVFAYSLTDLVGGFNAVFSDSTKVIDIQPNPELETLGNKIIQLGNPEGYGLLASYYKILKQDSKADELIEKGLEQGCEMCLTIALKSLEE